jgi:uncharacterized Zn finger protein
MPSRRPPDRSRRPAEGWWPPASKPIAVEGGLKARSTRGPIGDTWWSRRFIDVLESFDIGGRLERGRRYARTGQVLNLEFVAGSVSAAVQGSRAKPYRVSIETDVLTESEWNGIEDVMTSRAVFLAKLLSGQMPEEIEEAFAECSTTLFPRSDEDLNTRCSCPDWENPCKHIAAVFYLMAEAFDDDPFLIFSWRGRDKDRLLADLRVRRRGHIAVEPETRPTTDSAGTGTFGWPRFDAEPRDAAPWSDDMSFWGHDEDAAIVEVRPRLAVAADLILRQLDPSPLGDAAGIVDELRPLYADITSKAIAFAFGEESSPRGS